MTELEKLNQIPDDVDNELKTVEDLNQLQQKKAAFLGKKGPFSEIMNNMKNLGADAKKEIGMATNKIKQAIEAKFEEKRKAIPERINLMIQQT